MIAFDPNNDSHIAILIKWWGDISGEDRANLFHPTLHGLGPFLRFFTVGDTAHLLLMADAKGVWIAAWTSPFWDGALFSAWVRPDRRATKTGWTELRLACDVAFDAYPVVFSFTRQPALHATLTKLGFDYAGRLKRAIADAPVYFYEMTKEQWINRAETARQFRLTKREQRERQIMSHMRNGKTDQRVLPESEKGDSGQPVQGLPQGEAEDLPEDGRSQDAASGFVAFDAGAKG